MKNDADNPRPRSRSRSRKKAAPPLTAAPSSPATSQGPVKNVGSLESAFSLLLGILLLLAALFPRSIKQWLFLGMGGGLVYRGITSHCGLYQALDLDSQKGSLIQQVGDKYLSAGRD